MTSSLAAFPAAGAVELRRIRVDEYHRMIDAGILGEDDHVELLEGLIVNMSPQKPPHAIVIERLTETLITGLPRAYRVRCQLPLTLADSEPEPDVAVVPRQGRHAAQHPSSALLIFEVARRSLRYDREVKGRIYARAGVAEYVIVDLRRKQLEVWRDPAATEGRYLARTIVGASDVFASASVPGFTVPVSDLLADIG